MICFSNRELGDLVSPQDCQLRIGVVYAHLSGDELQSPVYSALCFRLVLFEEDRANKLIDGLVILEFLELLEKTEH